MCMDLLYVVLYYCIPVGYAYAVLCGIKGFEKMKITLFLFLHVRDTYEICDQCDLEVESC
jgi:hypothetical protein